MRYKHGLIATRVGLIAFSMSLISVVLSVASLKAQEPSPTNASLASVKHLPRLETEFLVVTDTQSLPSSIKRPAGPFFLQIVNRTFSSDLNITVEPVATERSNGQPMAPGSRMAARKRGRAAMLLKGEPGEYDIKAAGAGRILCHLVIGEQQ